MCTRHLSVTYTLQRKGVDVWATRGIGRKAELRKTYLSHLIQLENISCGGQDQLVKCREVY